MSIFPHNYSSKTLFFLWHFNILLIWTYNIVSIILLFKTFRLFLFFSNINHTWIYTIMHRFILLWQLIRKAVFPRDFIRHLNFFYGELSIHQIDSVHISIEAVIFLLVHISSLYNKDLNCLSYYCKYFISHYHFAFKFF